jgi:TP901 family phage tail tape measure protein
MAESIGTARLDIVVDTSSLDAGVNKAKRGTADMAKAAQDASQKMDAGTKRQVQALERQIATLGKSRAEVIKWRIEQQTSGRVAAELTAKLDAQSAKLANSAKRMEQFGASARRAAIGWAAIAAAAGGAALSMGVKNAIDFADKLNDINQRLGISAEALSGWAYAAQQTGTDIDGLGTGLKKLSRNMAEALDGTSRQGKLFAALGVNVKDAQGKLRSLEDILPEIASGFKGIQNETLKAALAQELFGKSGTELIEFLNLGSDGLSKMQLRARELGIELSQGTLTSADEFKDRLVDLKAASQGFSTQLAAELLPALTKLTKHLTEMVKDGTAAADSADLITTAIDGVGSALNRLDGIGDIISGLTQGFTELFHAASAVARLDFTTAANMFRNSDSDKRIAFGFKQLQSGDDIDVREDGQSGLFGNVISGSGDLQGRELALAQARMKRQKEAEGRLLGLFSEGSGRAKKPKKEGKSDAERELDRLEAAYKSFAAQQQERIALFGVESEAVKVRYELEHGELSKLTDAQAKKLGIDKEALIANAERLDQLREEAEVQKELDKINEARAERTKDVLADIQAEIDLLGKSVEYQDTYNKLKYAGVDANSAFGQSIIEANHALHEQAKATERQTALMDTFREDASSALTDVVTGAKSLSDAFKDMFDNIAEQITKMIANRWIEQLFGESGTTQSGSAGNWFSMIASIFASAKGNVFSGGEPVHAFANGGVFDSPTFFPMRGGRIGLMGEAGPEAIMPLERGSDGRLGVRASGGSSVQNNQLTQTFVVQGTPDNRTREQMARASGREAARGMSRTGR